MKYTWRMGEWLKLIRRAERVKRPAEDRGRRKEGRNGHVAAPKKECESQ